MPVHDWSKVGAGIFHDFHQAWITHLRDMLNREILPPDFYALIEQHAGKQVPDILTLHAPGAGENAAETDALPGSSDLPGTTALAVERPRVELVEELQQSSYVHRRRTIAIRHASNDRIVALLEILSPGNKSSRSHWEQLLEKLAAALWHGCHVLAIDIHHNGDNGNIHAALWQELGADEEERTPLPKPFHCAAYTGEPCITAFVQSFASGEPVPAMPLFLNIDHYVTVPLDDAYQAAYAGVPHRWQHVLEA